MATQRPITDRILELLGDSKDCEFDALVAGELKALGAALDAAGAPWTPRRRELQSP